MGTCGRQEGEREFRCVGGGMEGNGGKGSARRRKKKLTIGRNISQQGRITMRGKGRVRKDLEEKGYI